MIPLQNRGDHTDVNNLRPICLLPLLGKILERIVHRQLICYIENKNRIGIHQGGFRKGKSTVESVANFTEDI